MEKPSQILNAASNLLGIALVIIAGLNVSHVARSSFADEIAWASAICLGASCLLSYLSIRSERIGHALLERWADRVFLLGMITLFGSIVVLALGNR